MTCNLFTFSTDVRRNTTNGDGRLQSLAHNSNRAAKGQCHISIFDHKHLNRPLYLRSHQNKRRQLDVGIHNFQETLSTNMDGRTSRYVVFTISTVHYRSISIPYLSIRSAFPFANPLPQTPPPRFNLFSIAQLTLSHRHSSSNVPITNRISYPSADVNRYQTTIPPCAAHHKSKYLSFICYLLCDLSILVYISFPNTKHLLSTCLLVT